MVFCNRLCKGNEGGPEGDGKGERELDLWRATTELAPATMKGNLSGGLALGSE